MDATQPGDRGETIYDKFSRPSQVHALRALAFDTTTRAYLTAHPKAAVVALAEGLQPSFWRLDSASAREFTWYSMDLPPVRALRERLLPRDERIIELAQSALDRSWMDRVDDSGGVFVTAEGQLMYLEPDDAEPDPRLRGPLPRGQMMFDSVPPWFSQRTLKEHKLSRRYITPPMPFALTADEGIGLTGRIPGVVAARDIALPPGRGIFKLAFWPPLDRIGLLRHRRPSITLLEFG